MENFKNQLKKVTQEMQALSNVWSNLTEDETIKVAQAYTLDKDFDEYIHLMINFLDNLNQ